MCLTKIPIHWNQIIDIVAFGNFSLGYITWCSLLSSVMTSVECPLQQETASRCRASAYDFETGMTLMMHLPTHEAVRSIELSAPTANDCNVPPVTSPDGRFIIYFDTISSFNVPSITRGASSTANCDYTRTNKQTTHLRLRLSRRSHPNSARNSGVDAHDPFCRLCQW